MEIKYDPAYEDYYSSLVDRQLVEEAINNPDKKMEEPFENQESCIYFKRFGNVFNRYYVLVCAMKREDCHVHSAFIIPKAFDRKVHRQEPLKILEEFANKFGLEICIGRSRARFIHHQTFWVKKEDGVKLLDIPNPEGHAFVSSLLFKNTQEGNKICVEANTGYCIDIEAYKTWLGSQKY